jgi:phosphoketolase
VLGVARPCTWHCPGIYVGSDQIVIDEQPQLQYLSMPEAIEHCARGAGLWEWAGTDDGTSDPDIVLACAGDVVTMETVAAAQILKERLPTELKQWCENQLAKHAAYVVEHLEDMPEARDWSLGDWAQQGLNPNSRANRLSRVVTSPI